MLPPEFAFLVGLAAVIKLSAYFIALTVSVYHRAYDWSVVVTLLIGVTVSGIWFPQYTVFVSVLPIVVFSYQVSRAIKKYRNRNRVNLFADTTTKQ